MAACGRKELNTKAEIEYSSKIIDRAEYISDKTVVLKAYLRRGFAYELLKEYLKAKDDMLKVQEMKFANKKVSECLERLQIAINETQGDLLPKA